METFEQLHELISPQLTWTVFEKVLKTQNNCDDIKLINIVLGKEGKKGDSYLSKVTRFTVDYSGNTNGTHKVFTLHVFAKALLRNIARRKTFRSYDFFKNEICFYEKIWPQLDAFQKEMNVKDLFKGIPNYLCGYCDGIDDYILLEDLSFQGYEGIDRSVALNLENAKNIMRIFARFHALGVAFNHRKPELFDIATIELREGYFHETIRSWYTNFQKKLKAITLDAVQKELPDEYFKKLQDVLKRDVYGETTNECAAITKLRALTHGDAWICNFLLRCDESKRPLHSVMIDFQLTRRASLAQDLHFFIYSCTEAELRSEHYDDILLYYCKEFNAFYDQFWSDTEEKGRESALTVNELINELKANGMFGLSMSMEAIVMSLLDDDEVSDLDLIEGTEAVPLESVWIIKPLKTQEKRMRLAQFVKHMIDYNFI